jgi:hypothetical protein
MGTLGCRFILDGEKYLLRRLLTTLEVEWGHFMCYVLSMFAFIVTVLLTIPPSPVAEKYNIQSGPVFKTIEDCQAGLTKFGQMFTSGLPLGAGIRVQASCVASETVEG